MVGRTSLGDDSVGAREAAKLVASRHDHVPRPWRELALVGAARWVARPPGLRTDDAVAVARAVSRG